MVYVAPLQRAGVCLSHECQLSPKKDETRQGDRLARNDPVTQGRISIATELANNGIAENPFLPRAKAWWFQEELDRGGSKLPPQAENGALVVNMEMREEILVASHGAGGEEKEEGEEEGLKILRKCKGRNLQGNSHVAIALVSSLKACAKAKDLQMGNKLHMDIVQSGLHNKNVFVGNALVNMYAKCGAVEKARDIFDQLIVRDVVSWNALISGYTQNGHAEQAFLCFEQMQLGGVTPDAVTYVCLLSACGSIGALEKGNNIHAQIVRDTSLEVDMHVGTALVDMYAKFGLLTKAQESFDKLQVRNIVSWTSLIVGYAQHDQGEKAIRLYERMKSESISPNAVTFSCILKACSSVGAMEKGLQVHAEILKEGLVEKNNVVGNSLVGMYSKLGLLERAQQVFDELPVQGLVTWNALITGYAQHCNGEDTLIAFDRMRSEGFVPDVTTFACVVKACGNVGAVHQGQELHAEIVVDGLLEMDMVVGTALIDMYAHCCMLEEAQEVFDDLPAQDVVSWTALIAGYTQNGHGEEAINRFEQLQIGGLFPNAVTFSCVLKACGSIRAYDRGLVIHSRIEKEGWLGQNFVVANALVDMYARCGQLAEAQEVFDKLQAKDIASWNALVVAYSQQEHVEKALSFFERMEVEGFNPDIVTVSSILRACGRVGAICRGQEVHTMIAVDDGLMKEDIISGTALVEMYANCGMLAEAEDVFEEVVCRDVVLWNTLLAGYAQLGNEVMLYTLFQKMISEGQVPNLVTYSILLTIFSHQGLLDKGQSQFELLNKSYGMVPFVEHYTCMVDLLGRAGQIEEAVAVIEVMCTSANLAICFTLLGACQKWGNAELGGWAFEHAMQLDKEEAALYVFMTNII